MDTSKSENPASGTSSDKSPAGKPLQSEDVIEPPFMVREDSLQICSRFADDESEGTNSDKIPQNDDDVIAPLMVRDDSSNVCSRFADVESEGNDSEKVPQNDDIVAPLMVREDSFKTRSRFADVESDGNDSEKVPQNDEIIAPFMVREDSFKIRSRFADIESEGNEFEKQIGVPSGALRRRRASRSSRNNSERSVKSNSPSLSPSQSSSSDESENEGGATNKISENNSLNDQTSSVSVIKKTSHGKAAPKRRRKKPPSAIARLIRQKISEIDKALLLQDEEDGLEQLKKHSISEGGLLDDQVRRKVWPRLMGLRIFPSEILPTQEECEEHKYYNQVVMDVDRSLKRFPPGIKDEERPALQDQLTRLIIRVLLKHPHLHYYQGYHDVAITFLLVVGEEMGYHIMEKLSICHLQDFMAPTMDKTSFQLNFMYPIIEMEHADLYDFLEASEVGTIFALPWLITWFGHVLPDYEDVVRLYDFFLASPPMMPVYLATALVIHRRHEIMMSECDLASVHSVLSHIPSEIPFEKLLIDAADLYESYPPDMIRPDVERRMKILEARNAPPKNRPKPRKSSGFGSWAWNGRTIGIMAAVVVTPIILSALAYRFFSG